MAIATLYQRDYPKQALDLDEILLESGVANSGKNKLHSAETEVDIEGDINKLEFRLKEGAEERIREFISQSIMVSETYEMSLSIRKTLHVYSAVFTDYTGGDCSFFIPIIKLSDSMSVEMLPHGSGLQYIFELYTYVQVIGAEKIFPIDWAEHKKSPLH